MVRLDSFSPLLDACLTAVVWPAMILVLVLALALVVLALALAFADLPSARVGV